MNKICLISTHGLAEMLSEIYFQLFLSTNSFPVLSLQAISFDFSFKNYIEQSLLPTALTLRPLSQIISFTQFPQQWLIYSNFILLFLRQAVLHTYCGRQTITRHFLKFSLSMQQFSSKPLFQFSLSRILGLPFKEKILFIFDIRDKPKSHRKFFNYPFLL